MLIYSDDSPFCMCLVEDNFAKYFELSAYFATAEGILQKEDSLTEDNHKSLTWVRDKLAFARKGYVSISILRRG